MLNNQYSIKKISLFLFLSLFVSACVEIPETGQKTLMLTTPAEEKQMGEQAYAEVMKKEKISKDPRLNGILKRVGNEIAQEAAQPDFNWEFNIIVSEQVNAWCMPGGKVAFYTGIFPYLKNEAGMATVMGHEVAHAVLRHAGQRISQQMKQQLGLGLLSGATSGLFKNPAAHDQIMNIFGAGSNVAFALPHSRESETEADVIGLKYMAKAGYDPEEALRFWQRFSQAGGQAPPEFLSTHPAGATRINTIKRLLPDAKKYYQQAEKKYGLGQTL
ncbi:MAG TPA: M48 family metallopeptidase [Oligoflexia bacterium]|nr:M48 family metallopeptidase [Oligoflexia bacterium]